jgi:hypothetical protein
MGGAPYCRPELANSFRPVSIFSGGKVRQRMQALIGIAHPDFREDLLRQAFEMYRRCW